MGLTKICIPRGGQELPVLFRDEYLVAVHKPAGMLVHRTALDAHDRRVALQLVRRQLGRRVYPVHRLDKGTSGVLLFALQRETASRLSSMFRDQRVHKTYLAVVRGHPAESGEIDHPLGVSPEDVPAGRGPGALETVRSRAAFTRFQCLARVELPHRVDRYPTSRYALLRLEPLSGRRHQLRRHMKHVSHPIIGDTTYGKSRHNRLFADLFGCPRLLLACVEVRLPHPVDGTPCTISAPLSADFAAVVEALGWSSSLPEEWREPRLPRPVRVA